MVQILDVHVPRNGASAPTVLEQVLVPPLPEARAVGNVARVRAPLTALPSLVVPPMGLCDPTDIALEFEEEEEEEVEMFDGSIDRFEHSAFRPGRIGAARSRTPNKRSILALFFEQTVDVPVPQKHG